jgi:GNAT superfamily N-acetyltransferase
MPLKTAVEFRVASPVDALCVGVLATQVFLDTYATDGLRPDLAREALANYSPAVFEARIRDASNHIVLAERKRHLVALSECRMSAETPIPSLVGGMQLVLLYVQRTSQRLGIGAALLARAEAHARVSGARCLWLAAWDGNLDARKFYRAQGYDDVGATRSVFEGRAYDDVVYCKTLDRVA